MRFGLVHRVMTDALAALGLIALVSSGQFNRWISAAILVGLAGALAMREEWQRHPALRWLGEGALLLVMVAEGARYLRGVSWLDLAIEFAAALQIIRLATRKGAAHDQQVIVLALLHLVAGTVLGGGLGYGLCFLGVLVVAPGALVLSHLRREVEGNYRQGARDRTGLPVDVPRILRSRRVVGRTFLAVTCLLAVPIFLFTAVLFVVFPRVGLSLLLLPRPHIGRQIGFSPRVDLGDHGVLRDDPTIAMRVEIPNLPDPPPPRLTLHLRGTALDAYDGHAWMQSESSRTQVNLVDAVVSIDGKPAPDTDPVMKIDLEAIDPPVVFLPPNAEGVRFRTRGFGPAGAMNVYRLPEGELQYQPVDDRGVKYEVLLSPTNAPSFQRALGAADRARYLALSNKVSARVKSQAEAWTQGASSSLEKAKAVEKRLRTEFRYDLASPSSRKADPLDHFLFESKRGHCQFYATAMAIMLRSVGIPTRQVNGFIGGSYNRYGRFYAVRNGDAHSWVEAYIDGQGWLTFDPTPPGDAAPKSELVGFWAAVRDLLEATSQRWDRHIVGYDLDQQVGLFKTLRRRYRTSGAPGWQGPTASRRTLLVVSGAVLALGALAAYLWLRRRASHNRAETAPRSPRAESAALATRLYEALEAAMGAQGMARPPGLPPLRHAETLSRAAHPLGGEVLELTEIYLRARFGGEELSELDRRAFERRVKALRAVDLRPKKRKAAEAAAAAG